MKLLPLLLLLPALALAVPGPRAPLQRAIPAVGPVTPDAHPATSLREAVRRMRLSVGRELLLLARVEAGDALPAAVARQPASPTESSEPNTSDGFTEEPNDGLSTFEPLMPGTSVAPSNVFPDDPSPSAAPTPIPGPTGSDEDPTTDGAMITDGPVVDGPDPVPTPVTPDQSGDGVMTTTEDPVETDELVMVTVVPRPGPPGPGPGPTRPNPRPTTRPTRPRPRPDRSPRPAREPVVTPPPGEIPMPQPSDGPDGMEDSDDMMESPSPDIDDVLTGGAGGVPGESEPAASDDLSDLSPSPSPDDEDEDDDDSVCFPANALVELENGATKMMSQVQLGDRVRVGPNDFSDVFMFTHKTAAIKYSFVTLATQSGHTLSLTKGHYLYVNGVVAAAKTVRSGDFITLADGTTSSVTQVGTEIARGLYNPQTVHGDIIVNGLLATTYTTTVERSMAHALLAPLRAVYSSIGWSMSALDAGADRLAGIVPSGSVVA